MKPLYCLFRASVSSYLVREFSPMMLSHWPLSKLLKAGLWSLIGLELSLVVAYFVAIGQAPSVPNWLDWNGLRSLPSLIQATYLFSIGGLSLLLLCCRSQMQRPVSWLLPLALTVLCFYGAIDELTKLHLLLNQYDWKVIYLAILIAIPVLCRQDLIWLWQTHRSIVMWVIVGLGIFLLGGFGAESIKQSLNNGITSEQTLTWLGQEMTMRGLVEHIRTTIEEFAELLGETLILFGVAQFVLTSLVGPSQNTGRD